MSVIQELASIPWNIIDFIKEIHTLIPDSILFGSLLMYLLTHNLSFGVFAIFVFVRVIPGITLLFTAV